MKKEKKFIEKEYNILVGGAAGEGSRLAGLTVAKILIRLGWNISIFEDYQSLIMGGHSFSKIRATEQYNSAPKERMDFLIALNQETIEKHSKSLRKGGTAIYNIDGGAQLKGGIGISGKEVVQKFGVKPIMKNSAFLGAFAKAIGLKWEETEKIFREEFRHETEKNIQVAKYGYDLSTETCPIGKIGDKKGELITGNEAICQGALAAGMEFYSAYPMTPATGILHYFAATKEQRKTKVFQAENEIAVIMAALGAACAGKKSMVGTSGGGFALMTEAISMAGQAEIPIVIINSQRPGPATGIPTYSGQADLHFTLQSGHGDFLRFVVAPGDAQESAELTALALNMAWKYQMPAIVLTDKDVSEGTYMLDRNVLAKLKPQKEIVWDGQGEYKRYCQTNNGISPMAFYGTPGATIKVTSYDHDEFGITVEENENDIKKMADKRLKKYAALEKELEKMEACKIYGNKNAKKAIIAWGEVKGAAIEAAKRMGVKMIQPLILSPFPIRQLSKALKGVKKIVSIEMNATGQMAQLFRCHGFKIDSLVLKYTGRPFTVEELEKEITKKLK